MSHTLVVIDGNALLHRAFHAFPRLTTSKGELVNAVFGFSSILLKVMTDLKPDYMAVTFDRREPTFRHNEYADYKATRVKAPQELYDQLPRVKEIVESMNIPILEAEGYEADDVIGTITKKAQEKKDLETIIVTGDLDTLQLIDEKTKVYTPRKGPNDIAVYDQNSVMERFGLTPDQLIDYKTLRGDPSDNIKGVVGIGEKTAQKLLQTYKTIDGIYEHINELPEKIQTKLKNAHDELALLRRLVMIVRDVPIEFDITKCKMPKDGFKKTRKLFEELQFKSLITKLPKNENQKPENEQLSLM